MRIVEAGCDALSAEVDAARAGACEREHLGVRADGKYAAAGEGKRFDLGLVRAHRQDPAVVQNRVRASVRAGEGGGSRAEPGGDEGAAADASSHGFSSPDELLFDTRKQHDIPRKETPHCREDGDYGAQWAKREYRRVVELHLPSAPLA